MHVPQGITFGTKVVVLPGYVAGFTHSGKVKRLGWEKRFCWIKRGDPVGYFEIKGSFKDDWMSRLFDSKLHRVPVKSPVSGLLLNPHLTVENRRLSRRGKPWEKQGYNLSRNCSLLLPEDEPEPESAEFMYGDMCEIIRGMKHYYFRQSRYWSRPELTEDVLEESIEEQLTTNPMIFDALPHWGGSLDEARTMYPELRPYIKHLQAES